MVVVKKAMFHRNRMCILSSDSNQKDHVPQTRNAGTESEDLAAYCNNMAPITCRVGTQIFVVGLVTLMVAIGIININECNVNHLIPIYLVSLILSQILTNLSTS